MLNIDIELTKTEGWKRNGYFYIPSEKEYQSGTFSPYENFNNYDQYVKRLVKLNEDIEKVQPPKRPTSNDNLETYEKYVSNFHNIKLFRENKNNIFDYVYKCGIFDIPNFATYCLNRDISLTRYYIVGPDEKCDTVGELIDKLSSNANRDTVVEISGGSIKGFSISVVHLENYKNFVNQELIRIIVENNLV